MVTVRVQILLLIYFGLLPVMTPLPFLLFLVNQYKQPLLKFSIFLLKRGHNLIPHLAQALKMLQLILALPQQRGLVLQLHFKLAQLLLLDRTPIRHHLHLFTQPALQLAKVILLQLELV